MKEIMFFIDNLAGGGAEKVLKDIVNNMDYKRYKITVRTLFNEGIYINQLNENIKYETCLKKVNKLNKKIMYILIKFLPPKILYRIFINQKYSIEIAFLETASHKIISGSTSKSRKISWIHSYIYNSENIHKWFWSKKAFINSYKKFNNVFCVSNKVKEGYEKLTKLSNAITIYNPMPTKDIIIKSKENIDINIDKDFFIISSIGRLEEDKGYLRLLKCINELYKQGIKVKLYILGIGSKKKELQEYIKINKLQNIVYLLNFQENPYKYIIKSNLFISSSFTEGFSLALLEAIILGIPVISTNTEGPSEIIGKNEYGLLVENSEKGIYEGLKKVIKDKDFYKTLVENVKSKDDTFNIDKVINNIQTAIDGGRKI